MVRRRDVLASVAIIVGLAILGLVMVGPEAIAPADDAYERTTVTHGEDQTIDVRIADTLRKRYVGLSATESLDTGEGMLFVHRSEGSHTYVMRAMDFPIDIVFIASNRTVTEIHHAPVPADGNGEDARYTGTAKYVLEVPMGYTNETGLEPGDRVEIDGY